MAKVLRGRSLLGLAVLLGLAPVFLAGNVQPGPVPCLINGANNFNGNSIGLHAPGPWTAVASTGAVDESAFSIFATTQSQLHYKSSSSSNNPITARYNVTSPVPHPPWKTLELGYFDNWKGAVVYAELHRVDPCTGAVTPQCRATSTDSAVAQCVTCDLPEPLDFEKYLYYVFVSVDRSASTQKPAANTLRLLCTPSTCADLGDPCGIVPDGCGGCLSCETCD